MWNPLSKHTIGTVLKPSPCTLTITPDGLIIKGPTDAPAELLNTPTHLPTTLWTLRHVLLEKELATQENDTTLTVPFDALLYLKEGFASHTEPETFQILDENLSELFPPLSPFTLKIANSGPLASPQLTLEFSFWLEGIRQYPDRTAPWLTDMGQSWLLNQTQWQLCDMAEAFNKQDNKGLENNYARLAEFYETLGLQPDNIQLDTSLGDVEILAPSQMTVGWQSEGNTCSAYPVFTHLPGAHEEAVKKAFFQQDGNQSCLSLTSPNGKQTRVLLTPDMRETVKHLRHNMRGLKPSIAKALALPGNLAQSLDGIAPPDMLALDMATYGPRVIGLGPLVFKPVVKVKTIDGVCLLPDNWQDLKRLLDEEPNNCLAVQAQNGTGETVSVDIPRQQIELLQQQVQDALTHNVPSIDIVGSNGETITLQPTADLALQLETGANGTIKHPSNETATEPKAVSSTQQLLKTENEFEKQYDLTTEHTEQPGIDWVTCYQQPENLNALLNNKPFNLANYQKIGVAWLQQSFLAGKRGVLLADDMGLGKTLQVLTFLAWLLETGWAQWHQSQQTSLWQPQAVHDQGVNPHPVLVVVPKMLMENWRDEIRKFFKGQGEVFQNFELLDSKRAKEFMVDRSRKGSDFATGRAGLNHSTLQSYRLLVVNYDTAKNYYQSLAKIRWACVVMDESQAIKNPQTAVNHALACIADNSRFRITMTGTPIENDLIDLWALMDVVVPGVLDSQQQFKKQFFNPETGWQIESVKTQLRLRPGTAPDEAQLPAFVLGRTKQQFLNNELPDLQVQQAEICHFEYTASEWQQQADLIQEIVKSGKRALQLEVIQRIKLFAEHPVLALPKEKRPKDTITLMMLLENSSKFRWLQKTLKTIKQNQEKALIFTRSIQMQAWINLLLEKEFGYNFPPINGTVTDKRQGGQKLTYKILDDFNRHQGFAALVLSPEVAGVGLNITCANHVIHYGRWWNPAKEDQATCRAYRKGQQKMVYLYVPVGKAPLTANTTSFDERLNTLLNAKTEQRKNFLYPCANIEEEDLSQLFPDIQLITPQLEGHQFEKRVADWMIEQGFEQVKLTPQSNDFGADVVALKENKLYLVQCKRTLKEDEEVVKDLQRSFLHYGSNYPGKTYVFVAACCAFASGKTQEFYEKSGVEVWKLN